MNVLAWAKKGYAKTGSAMRLNQETSRWIALRKLRVEPFYLRSGHNFSPDWTTRTGPEEVRQWARDNGFTRIRARPYWDEMLEGRSEQFEKEITFPLGRRRVAPINKLCAEWNGSWNAFNTAAGQFGIIAKVLNARHQQAKTVFQKLPPGTLYGRRNSSTWRSCTN